MVFLRFGKVRRLRDLDHLVLDALLLLHGHVVRFFSAPLLNLLSDGAVHKELSGVASLALRLLHLHRLT